MTQDDNSTFASKMIEAKGPHALIGDMIVNMTAIEAHLLVMSCASRIPSSVPQAILRDVMNRTRIKLNGEAPT